MLLQNATAFLLQNMSGFLFENVTILLENAPVIAKFDVFYKTHQHCHLFGINWGMI